MTAQPEAQVVRTLWLVCHDHPADERQIAGRGDVGIRASSRRRYDALRNALPSPAQALAFRSPARRAVKTTARLWPETAWGDEHAIHARDFGLWEGRTWPQIRDDDPVRCEAFWHDLARARAPQGESLADVGQRVEQWLGALRDDPDWTHAVVVTHPEVIRAAICMVLEIDLKNALRLGVDTLCLTRLRTSWAGWTVDAVNHSAHSDPKFAP